MRLTHIGQVDLNLLPALVALLDEKHVSRAAARVGLSQPAMSRALRRARLTFDDELLVRTPSGYHLTPRAQRIRSQLSSLVPRLETLFGGEQFDPATAELTFQLAGSDYALSVLGSKLFGRVLDQSPGTTLRFQAWHDNILDEVRSADVDLAFFGGLVPADLQYEQLFTERFVCVVCRDHPLAEKSSVTLDTYLDCTHLIVDLDEGGQPAIEQPLKALGVRRRAGLITPYHATAPGGLPGTRLVATLPERLIQSHGDPENLCVLDAPEEIETMNYKMCWDPLLNLDAGHMWMREIVSSVTRSLESVPRRADDC